MLSEITIENVAVIEKATAGFSTGFTVLTGETGAGKSILIDSVNAILGNRTSRDIVRSGAEKAAIWASFTAVAPEVQGRLSQAGYEAGEDLLLQRDISVDGKGNCRINGAPATASMLRDICGGLVNIHGQHDNQSLLNPARHIHVLDIFAQNAPLLESYGEAFKQLSQLRQQMQRLSMDEAEKARRIDLLGYEVEEIDSAKLQPGEEETLNEQREVIRNAETILEALNGSYMALNGDDEMVGAATLLADAARQMAAAARFAPELEGFAASLNEAYYTASEAASDIQARLNDFEFGEQSLEQVERRLDVIYRLKQKYGGSVEAVSAYGDKARQELETITSSEERLRGLQAQEKQAHQTAQALAGQLTARRTEAFERLKAEIAGALDYLNMPGITMALDCRQAELGPAGQDEVEFFISTNPGEAPKPLAKIASGGELARIMLAIKSALADRDDIGTVIYDEIDTGISGMAAGRIGRLLHDTSTGRQVICVTHTAQVAAFADKHLLIEKQVREGRTYTHIRALDRPGRVEELARIISGDNVTETARANALEMLELAEKHKSRA